MNSLTEGIKDKLDISVLEIRNPATNHRMEQGAPISVKGNLLSNQFIIVDSAPSKAKQDSAIQPSNDNQMNFFDGRCQQNEDVTPLIEDERVLNLNIIPKRTPPVEETITKSVVGHSQSPVTSMQLCAQNISNKQMVCEGCGLTNIWTSSYSDGISLDETSPNQNGNSASRSQHSSVSSSSGRYSQKTKNEGQVLLPDIQYRNSGLPSDESYMGGITMTQMAMIENLEKELTKAKNEVVQVKEKYERRLKRVKSKAAHAKAEATLRLVELQNENQELREMLELIRSSNSNKGPQKHRRQRSSEADVTNGLEEIDEEGAGMEAKNRLIMILSERLLAAEEQLSQIGPGETVRGEKGALVELSAW